MAEQAVSEFPVNYAPAASRWPVTLRQLMLVVGLAATVAAAVAVILWSQTPAYVAVQAGMNDRDAAEVVALLQSSGIPYELEGGSGTVMVPGGRKNEVRLLLAEAGLPRSSAGMERLRDGSSLGQTPFMENAFYWQALQTELAQTIMELRPVQAARVHLAVPTRSVFLRDRQSASASVMLEMFPGRVLDQAKVAAVVHLVASSVPELEPDQVTVVNERGELLTHASAENGSGVGASQFEFTKRYEQLAAQAIEAQLSPVLGASRVRATVAADLDFTIAREIRKTFDPNSSVVIAEEQEQETRRGELAGAGIPGALTNQPPEEPVAAAEEGPAGQTISSSSRRRSNFDVDETFRETQLPTGTVQKLSVAVLIDNKASSGDGPGEPLTQEELDGLTELAKRAVGFDEARGDTIAVLNSAFLPAAEIGKVEPPPIWEQPWVWDIARQLSGVILVLLLALFVVKPIVKNLTTPEPPPLLPGGAMGGMPGMGAPSQIPAIPQGYDERMAAARSAINQDPRQVAQVMRDWTAAADE